MTAIYLLLTVVCINISVIIGLKFNISPKWSKMNRFEANINKNNHVYKSLPLYNHMLPEDQQELQVYITDEQLEEYLQDMIYSGDISGYIKRNAKNIVNDDFISYLKEKIDECKDEDELSVYNEIDALITQKLSTTDGITNSGIVFENRLDKILFSPPNLRRKMMEDNIDDLSPGFISYIQQELAENPDIDSKVVLASILQLIGDIKSNDYLGTDDRKVLMANADASLGDQFAKKNGFLDDKVINDPNEQILASLLFSTTDILEDVLNNLHVINDGFLTFLQNKIDKSSDIDERVGLTSLLQTISTVLARVKEVQGTDGASVAEKELDMNQIKEKMQEIQMGGNKNSNDDIKGAGKSDKAASIASFSVKQDKKDTFENILKRFQNLPEGTTLAKAVELNYELCDYEFMDALKKEAAVCFSEGAEIEGQLYLDLLTEINNFMAVNIGNAQDRMKRILSKRTLPAMESEIVSMVRKNEVDEALVLLIEANLQQAEAAGVQQAVDVLRKLSERIKLERERLLPDEQRLLRALLRLTDAAKRKELLFEGFKPYKSMGSDGEMKEGPPLISPPSFINLVRQFITNFGNVDKFDIMGRAELIINEAQEIATDLYGEGMSPREQQKLMFEKNTVSVWDLADFEYHAELSGEEVPWRNDAFDTKNPEDVLHDKVKRIGGGP